MLMVGWIGCPQCDYRRRVCVEVDPATEAAGFVLVTCVIDSSTHRISLLGFQPVAECPPEMTVSQPTDFAPESRRRQAIPPPRPWWKFWG